MGEIADMMLDGTLCEGCGEYIDDEVPGYPRYCSAKCAGDRGVIPPKIKEECPVCHKRLKLGGLRQHMEAKHPS
jgi:hypothetical protein